MATEVLMPQMGESITEGTLTKWLKKVGDTVTAGERIGLIKFGSRVDVEFGPEWEILVKPGMRVSPFVCVRYTRPSFTISRQRNSPLRNAAVLYSSLPKTRAHSAIARRISEFHDARIFSSRAGQTRFARTS